MCSETNKELFTHVYESICWATSSDKVIKGKRPEYLLYPKDCTHSKIMPNYKYGFIIHK